MPLTFVVIIYISDRPVYFYIVTISLLYLHALMAHASI